MMSNASHPLLRWRRALAALCLACAALASAACEELNPRPSGLLGFTLNGSRWEAETVDVTLSRSSFAGESKTMVFTATALDGSTMRIYLNDVEQGSQGDCLPEKTYHEPGDPKNDRQDGLESNARLDFVSRAGESFTWVNGEQAEVRLTRCSEGDLSVSGDFSGTVRAASSSSSLEITDGSFDRLKYQVAN